MRMVKRRLGTNAHEFLGPDVDGGFAHGVVEMRRCAAGHCRGILVFVFRQ